MLLFLSWACQEERLTEAAKGAFTIALVDDTLGIQTKAQQAINDELAAQFQLTVRNAAGYTFYEGGYTADPITVPAGTYTVSAALGKDNDLAIDAPYYTGEASNVVVEATKDKAVTIPCQIANALVSVNWANQAKIDKVFTNYGVKVAVNSYSAILSPENSERKVYLKAGQPVSFYFVGTLRSTGEEKTAQLVSDQLPSSLQARDHCRLTLTIDDRLAMQIEKAEIKQESINETIPLEWLPKPKVEGFANQATTLTYVETADAIPAAISFTAAHDLQDVEFTLNLGDELLQSLNKTYTLSTLTEEEQTALAAAGISLPTLGQMTGSLDLTAMTAHLLTNNGSPVNNEIKLRVKANDRWSAEADAAPVYTIQTVKPKFSVSVDERNSWSREFTIEPATVETGNAEKIMSDLTYQYFDGTEWVDCQSREQVKGRLQQFTAAAEDLTIKSYRVRALYRGVVTSTEATATLEEPTPIPNGGMEEWQLDNYQGSRYSFNPWSEGESSGFWDTNNLFTTRHRTNSSSVTMANYNGMAAVSLVPGRSGLAAELRSTANGKANTRLASWLHSEKDYNKVAGELYCGTAKVTTGNNDADASSDKHERIKDSAFGSRPSTLQFWYKYVPFDNTERFSVTVEQLDKDKNVIATNYVECADNTGTTWKMMQIPFTFSANEKCAFIHVLFCSTTVTGANMKYKECTYTLYKSLTDTYSFDPAYVGSVLTIDDIQLIYDK